MLSQYLGRLILVGHASIEKTPKETQKRRRSAQSELNEMMSDDGRDDNDGFNY